MPNKPPIHKTKKGEERHYAWDSKQFYGVAMSEKSELSKNREHFYGPGTEHATSRKELSTNQVMENFKNSSNDPHRRTTTDLHLDMTRQHFKKDAANFYGESYKSNDPASSKGSIFQDNAAEFYGLDHPEHGDKPFKIHQENLKDPKVGMKQSVLNEKRLKNHENNMQRHPMYGKNLKRFWGQKSNTNSAPYMSSRGSSSKGSRQGSYAQKLTGMIG
jgi:hypothetical protein